MVSRDAHFKLAGKDVKSCVLSRGFRAIPVHLCPLSFPFLPRGNPRCSGLPRLPHLIIPKITSSKNLHCEGTDKCPHLLQKNTSQSKMKNHMTPVWLSKFHVWDWTTEQGIFELPKRGSSEKQKLIWVHYCGRTRLNCHQDPNREMLG